MTGPFDDAPPVGSIEADQLYQRIDTQPRTVTDLKEERHLLELLLRAVKTWGLDHAFEIVAQVNADTGRPNLAEHWEAQRTLGARRAEKYAPVGVSAEQWVRGIWSKRIVDIDKQLGRRNGGAA